MGWLRDALPEIVRNGAPWLIVFLVVVGWVRYVKRTADDRIAEQRAHHREIMGLMQQLVDIGRGQGEITDQTLKGLRTVETFVRELPPGGGS